MKTHIKLLLAIVSISLLVSCVSQKEFTTAKSSNQSQINEIKKEINNISSELNKLNKLISTIEYEQRNKIENNEKYIKSLESKIKQMDKTLGRLRIKIMSLDSE